MEIILVSDNCCNMASGKCYDNCIKVSGNALTVDITTYPSVKYSTVNIEHEI